MADEIVRVSNGAAVPVHVNLLGPFSVVCQGPVRFSAKSAEMVFAYLLLNRERWVSRAELREVFWPETEASNAAVNLRQSLHRLRQALAETDALMQRDDEIRVNPEAVWTDLQEADELHRRFLFAPHLEESVADLHEEWKLVSRSFLEGWTGDWIDAERDRLLFRAHELGITLAQALEALGNDQESLAVIRQVAQDPIFDFEVFERALKLEHRLNGPAAAYAFYDAALANMANPDELPGAIKSLIRKIRQTQFEVVPTSDLFESRNELSLLARIVESNLKSGNAEAMELLAKESRNLEHWAHPATLLSILTTALDHSQVQTDAEIEVAINACFLGSYASDYSVGIWAGQRALAALPEDDIRAVRALSVLAFLNFETKNYSQARDLFEQAVTLSSKAGNEVERPRVLNRFAVLEYHLGRFDAAKEMFLEAIELEKQNERPNKDQLLASYHSNICTMEALRHGWEEASRHGELAFRFAENNGKVYRIYVMSGYGLSRAMLGDPQGAKMVSEGIRLTATERMRRFNMMANDFGAYLIGERGRKADARQIAGSNGSVRDAAGYPRGPAEIAFLSPLGEPVPARQLSLLTISRWLIEAIQEIPA